MQNDSYLFQWKHFKGLFWRKKKVSGHAFLAGQNKMVLYLPDHGLQEIAHWSECECRLEADWFLAQKQQAEQEAGQVLL